MAVQFLPERIPIRYNAAGEIEAWGSRYICFVYPLEILILTAFFEFIAYSFDRAAVAREKKHRIVKTPESARNNAKVIRKITPWAAGVSGVMQLFMLIKFCADGNAGVANLDIDITRAYTFLMGILYIVLGNIMPKVRRNGLVGFRVSWTLYNDTTWQKSNRFAAAALMIDGVFTIISTAFVGGIAVVLLMLLYMTMLIIVIMIYAKRVYDEEKAKEKAEISQ